MRQWITTFVCVSSLGTFAYYVTRNTEDPATSSTLPLSNVAEIRHDHSPRNLRDALGEFTNIIGKEHVSTSDKDIENHATSSWSSHPAKSTERSFCVLWPGSTDEVSQIMKVCHKRHIPVIGYSGGTSLEGHFTPTRHGVSIDFGRMNKILSFHKEDLDVVVQPAIAWEALNDHLDQEGLFFPPDPGPGAMIGGMVGTGCSGTNAYRYGTIREWVLSLTVVLADGTVIKTRQRPRKSSAGYDLTKLFIGSEGTLGLVTEATLKITTKPESTSVAVAAFPSIRNAADCVAKVFAGTKAGVKEQIAQVQALAQGAYSTSFEFAKNQEEQDELWSARKEALWSVLAVKKPDDRVWTGDVAVPMSRLPDLIEATKEDLTKSGLFASIVGHVGDGNFHAMILYNDQQRTQAEAVVHRMVKRAIDMEGTVSGEHGVGLVKRDYLSHELGQTTVDAMRQIKRAFDPLCLLNCDKVVRMQDTGEGSTQKW
ncbi:D-lactate dehydrogenase [cytochrome], mitochondrial [Metarhizium anisopliae]|nr:D-lactate dehydrogenase [cytochrome], mitochondrial [Metarhizium anisopliae]